MRKKIRGESNLAENQKVANEAEYGETEASVRLTKRY